MPIDFLSQLRAPAERSRMDNAILPIEVCEQIIDLTASEPPLWTTQEEYETFRRCALVCRAWRPRSQWNLFYSIHLTKAPQVDRLLNVFSDHPSLAYHIKYVHIGDFDLQTPPSGGPFTKEGYIPFATGRLTRALRNARVFRLTGLTWPSYPPVYTSLFRQFKSLVELQINSVSFGSAGDVIRMAWNCPALEVLSLEYIRITQYPSEAECARLLGSRRANACNHLRKLVLEDWYDSDTTPPLLALGDTITSLQLSFNTTQPWRSGGRVLDMVSRYHALEVLHLTIAFTGSEPSTPAAASAKSYRHTPLLELLSRIQPGRLRKLVLTIRPHITRRTLEPVEDDEGDLIPVDDIPWRTYLITRSQMINKVIGHDMKAILDQERFVNLQELEFEIEDDVWTHGVDWWLERLDAVLPRWPQHLGVKVDYPPNEDADTSELWLEDDSEGR